MGPADLHIHTTASDGRWTVTELLNRAALKGMSALAITDHDTVDSLAALANLKQSFPVEIIPGIEFNTDADLLEVHILGYFIDILNSTLQKKLGDLRKARTERVKEMVMKLTKLGYALEFADIQAQAGGSKALGRPHVAAALVAKGYFAMADRALYKLISKGGPAYIPHYKLSPRQAIETVLAAGGIPVMAHPGLTGDDNYIKTLIAYGIMGLEVYHPQHDKAMTNHYNQLAHNHQLIVTGGSDFHGIPGRFPEDLGEFSIPYHFVQQLNERRYA